MLKAGKTAKVLPAFLFNAENAVTLMKKSKSVINALLKSLENSSTPH